MPTQDAPLCTGAGCGDFGTVSPDSALVSAVYCFEIEMRLNIEVQSTPVVRIRPGPRVVCL